MSDETSYTLELEFRDSGRQAEKISGVRHHHFDDFGFLHVRGRSAHTKFRMTYPAAVIHGVKAREVV